MSKRIDCLLPVLAGFLALLSGRPAASGAVIATEDFQSYPADSDLHGGAGGVGWTANWVANSSTHDRVVDPGAPLTFSSPDGLVVNGGNRALQIAGVTNNNLNDFAYRTFPDQTGDIYFSFLFRTPSGTDGNDFVAFWFDIATGGNHTGNRANIGVKDSGSGVQRLFVRYNIGIGTLEKYGPVVTPGADYFVVSRLYKSNPGPTTQYDRFSLWVNPGYADEANPLVTALATNTTAQLNYLGLRVANFADDSDNEILLFDELRLGTSWDDVVPPLASDAPVGFRVQPSDQTVWEGQPATFTAVVTGTPPYTLRWERDGFEIPGANGLSYTTPPVTEAEDGAVYRLRADNAFGTANSSNAVLRVRIDTNGPVLLQTVALLNRTNLLLTFDERLDPGAAQDAWNYEVASVPGGASLGVLSATLTNGTNVLLTTTARTPGVNYTLTARELIDASPRANRLAPNPTTVTVAQEVVLVAGDGQIWNYFQSNTSPGTGWQRPGFDDTSGLWAVGPALFDAKRPAGRTTVGPNNEPVRTVLNLTNPPTATSITITYYFRTPFQIPGPLLPGMPVRLRTLVDDGVVLYLNGAEAFRLGLPAAPAAISYTNFATRTQGDTANAYEGPFDLSATNLVQGENLLAAEVHQANLGSSDVSFAAELIATVAFYQPPSRLTLAREGNLLVLSWTGEGVLEEAPAVHGPWSRSDNQANPQALTSPAGARFYRVRQ